VVVVGHVVAQRPSVKPCTAWAAAYLAGKEAFLRAAMDARGCEAGVIDGVLARLESDAEDAE
jgi:hypothetical protein